MRRKITRSIRSWKKFKREFRRQIRMLIIITLSFTIAFTWRQTIFNTSQINCSVFYRRSKFNNIKHFNFFVDYNLQHDFNLLSFSFFERRPRKLLIDYNNTLKPSEHISLMENQEYIDAKDLEHGHFYKDLHEEPFCFFDTKEGRFLQYIGNGSCARPGKRRIDTVSILSHGVSEFGPRDYSEELEEEIRRIKSLEQLARETTPI